MVAAYPLACAPDHRGTAAAARAVVAAGRDRRPRRGLLTQDFCYYMFRGTSEPMLSPPRCGRSTAFIDGQARTGLRARRGHLAASAPRRGRCSSLYGAWLWLEGAAAAVAGRRRPVLDPVRCWFGPPWIGVRQPFLAAIHAKDYNGHLGKHPFLEVLRRGADLQMLPVLLAGVVASVITWFDSHRDWLMLRLAGAVVGWWVLVVGMTLDGYPGLERFYLPAAG